MCGDACLQQTAGAEGKKLGDAQVPSAEKPQREVEGEDMRVLWAERSEKEDMRAPSAGRSETEDMRVQVLYAERPEREDMRVQTADGSGGQRARMKKVPRAGRSEGAARDTRVPQPGDSRQGTGTLVPLAGGTQVPLAEGPGSEGKHTPFQHAEGPEGKGRDSRSRPRCSRCPGDSAPAERWDRADRRASRGVALHVHPAHTCRAACEAPGLGGRWRRGHQCLD